ncbi:MAG: PilN domain-containing protein [Nitrospiraceae bacterium]|jgi:type IV pilus assembly protein PilN|nr:MAG: PilN domain-containing protein [Nitrospiraceae bacterium]
MIKVNLLPEKKKRKKPKQIPAFLLAIIGLTVLVGVVLALLYSHFNSEVEARQVQVRENEIRLKKLEDKIREVEAFERRNALFKNRKEIIEQLGKNKTIPVKVLDEISSSLPAGVWINTLQLSGNGLDLKCTAFTNTDVVEHVNKLKQSKMFSDVYLRESIQQKQTGFSLYNYSISMKVSI